MRHVLVHIDSDLGPIGAWSYDERTRKLRHFYPQSLDLDISGRARELMAARTPEVAVPEWFLYLTTIESGLDSFQALVINDNIELVEIISDYRRAWNAKAI